MQDTVQYACRDGFILKGNKEMSCRKDGSFENLKPFCMRISCGTPPVVENSIVLSKLLIFSSKGTSSIFLNPLFQRRVVQYPWNFKMSS